MQQEKTFRNDAHAKVTGRAVFADDISYAGMLHMVPVYADYVAARDVRVHTDAALKVPGVRRVFTAKDVPGTPYYGQIRKDYPILVSDTIRSWGDVVALVLADTREAALEGAGLVTVDATEERPILTIDDALDPYARVIPLHGESNIVNHHRLRRGDPDARFAECELVVEEEFETQTIEQGYLEPESAVCVPRTEGVIEIYGSMQHPFSTRRFTAAFLGERLANFEVFTIAVGGGFGGKDDTAAVVCARAALGARLTGRPVKMTYTREWSMRESYKRHPYRLRYKVGVSSEGQVLAVRADIHADSGAYLSVTPWVTWRSTAQCFGPYTVEDVHADVYGVATNNVFNGAMRGFGAPQVNFAVEQIMDIIAHRLKIHPLGLRRINMVKQGSTTVTGQVLDQHTVSMEEVMNKVVHEIGYRKKFEQCSFGAPRAADGAGGAPTGQSAPDALYGIGLAISYRGASLGAEGMDFCSAVINAQFDGSILLETGIHENGQGSESVMMLVLAEELGVSLKRVRYRRSSTSTIPDSGTTVATRGTIMGSSAVVVAARTFRDLLTTHLAERLRCTPQEVRFHDDRIWGRTFDDSLSWEEAMRELFLQRVTPYAFGTFQAPDVSWDETNGQGNAYFTYVYSCQAAEVSVSRKTGKIKLLNVVAAHDIGRAINRAMVFGQIYGGVTQGAGMALMEEIKHTDGRITNLNLDGYRIPRMLDMPEMSGIIVENTDPASLTGAKGIGEPALELISPAIANAVYNATGIRVTKMPLTIDPEELK